MGFFSGRTADYAFLFLFNWIALVVSILLMSRLLESMSMASNILSSIRDKQTKTPPNQLDALTCARHLHAHGSHGYERDLCLLHD